MNAGSSRSEGSAGAESEGSAGAGTRQTRVEWIERWKDVIAAEPELPGVWRRQAGGYHVRARVIDPRTTKMREVNLVLPHVSRARDAYAMLQAEVEKIRAGTVDVAPRTLPSFREYAAQVFERKQDLGKIRSAAGRAKWQSILEHHLNPAFGNLVLDQFRPQDIKSWQAKVGAKIRTREMAPTSANTILSVLRQITDEAVGDFDIRDPLRGVDLFDTREHSTYTEEEPNSLAPQDVPQFLAKMRELHAAHFGFTFLGLTTGLRPSSLRPLRRLGPNADIKWEDGILLIRRSHTLGNEVMETTKTDLHQRLALPRGLLNVLLWHVETQLLSKKKRESELIFPAVNGGFRSRSCLDKPFEEVRLAIGLPYRFTPRGMRRTYQDLARAAGVHDAVTRAISGHATPAMQLHYSTARGAEVRDALAAVADIATSGQIIDLAFERSRRQRSAAQ